MKKFEFRYQFEFFCSPIWIEENVKNPTSYQSARGQPQTEA